MDASDRPFTISGAPPAASLTVTNPNGGETWFLRVLRGNTATVTWTAQNVSGDLTVVLKKGGTPVRTQTFTNAGSCAFSYAGVAEGDDYRIRIESADGRVADESNGNFSIKKETLVAVEAKPISMVLSVSDFKLNNGAETTQSSGVTMDHVARGNPTHYRWRNEASPEWGPWVPYTGAHPAGQIPDSGLEHTIYFQVKNDSGESAPVSDSIRYGEREYEFGPGALADCPCPRGFAITGWQQFKVIEQSFPRNLVPDPTQVICADNHAGCYWEIVIEVKSLGYMFVRYGTKTEFEFFAGRQLKEGWSFVRLEYEGEEGEGYGYRITRMPQPGSRDITFRVRVWADSNISSCTFRIKRIIVKGPANVNAGAAFQ
jgi:hypothetical protein